MNICQGTGRRGEEKSFILYDISSTPMIRQALVKVQASPDDPLLKEYWLKRQTKQGKNHKAQGSKKDKLAKEQNWKCPICGDSRFNSEEIETHHIVPVAEGGTDDTENLMHLHRACHKQVHSKSKLKAGSEA